MFLVYVKAKCVLVRFSAEWTPGWDLDSTDSKIVESEKVIALLSSVAYSWPREMRTTEPAPRFSASSFLAPDHGVQFLTLAGGLRPSAAECLFQTVACWVAPLVSASVIPHDLHASTTAASVLLAIGSASAEAAPFLVLGTHPVGTPVFAIWRRRRGRVSAAAATSTHSVRDFQCVHSR